MFVINYLINFEIWTTMNGKKITGWYIFSQHKNLNIRWGWICATINYTDWFRMNFKLRFYNFPKKNKISWPNKFFNLNLNYNIMTTLLKFHKIVKFIEYSEFDFDVRLGFVFDAQECSHRPQTNTTLQSTYE